MTIYLIIIIYLLLSLFLNVNKKKNVKKYWLICTFFILTVVSAIRSYTVGVDTKQYYNAYKLILLLDWNQTNLVRYEIGFFYLNKLISLLSNNPQFFLAVTSCIIIPSVGIFIYKYSKDVVFSTILYVLLNIFFFHMTGMRQSIAVAILLFAIPYMEKKEYIKFSILVVIAFLFHTSAILFLITIVLDKFKYKNKTFLYTILITLICIIFFKSLFTFTSNFVGKYDGYMNSAKYGGSNYFGAFFQFLLTFFVYTFCHILFTNMAKNGRKERILQSNELFLKLLSVDVICNCMAMRMSIIGRMNQYFWIYSIILLPNLIGEVKEVKTRHMLYVSTIFLTLLYWLIVAIYRPEWNGAIPYSVFN